jgi:hypothetical protein
MDFSITFIVLTAGFLIILLVFWLGFKILPKPEIPDYTINEEEPASIPLPNDLPLPFATWLNLVYDQHIIVPQTLTAWGNGQIITAQLAGLGPLWAPLRYQLTLTPGQNFVWKTQVMWLGRTYFKGGDQFKEGKGKFQMGENTLENPNIDRGEQTVLWLYTICLAPSTLVNNPLVQFKTLDDHTVEVVISPSDFPEMLFTLLFDPNTHHLRQINTTRTTSKEGKNLPYSYQLDHPQKVSVNDPISLPSYIIAGWENDPYYRFKLHGVEYNTFFELKL